MSIDTRRSFTTATARHPPADRLQMAHVVVVKCKHWLIEGKVLPTGASAFERHLANDDQFAFMDFWRRAPVMLNGAGTRSPPQSAVDQRAR